MNSGETGKRYRSAEPGLLLVELKSQIDMIFDIDQVGQ